MNKDFVAKHFKVQELVSPECFKRWGERAIRYINPRLLAVLDSLREQAGVPMTCNNWSSGGDRVGSGLRLWGDKHYSLYSAHSFGMAADLTGFDVDKVRRDIISGCIVLPYHVRLELGVTWLHVDVMNVSDDRVVTFHP